MNLNPKTWFAGSKAAQASGSLAREAQPQGPWTGVFNDWTARQVAPRFYEALREAVPVVDAAINRLVTLDGIVRVEAASDALQQRLDEFTQGVQVADLGEGLQAMYSGWRNEIYEQGFGVCEWVLQPDGRGVGRLNVGDSKGFVFRRNGTDLEVWYRPPAQTRADPALRDGTGPMERLLRGNLRAGCDPDLLRNAEYQQLDRASLIYGALHPEADNPYGVSIMRSMEFVAKVLVTMDNALLQTWGRFGDPAFALTYKAGTRLADTTLETRRQTLADNLTRVLASKRDGKSADFVNAVGKDDTLEIAVIGADGQVLDIEQPAKHVLEQVVAKTGLPPWILGYVWGTAERLANRQGEILLQESRTRFELSSPPLKRVVAAHLRAGGVTWGRDDWQLVQELPSLQDLVAQAQAAFLEAQTDLMLANAGGVPEVVTTEESADPAKAAKVAAKVRALCNHRHKESWVEDDPALPRLERRALAGLRAEWQATADALLDALELPRQPGKADLPVFAFDIRHEAVLRALEAEFVDAAGAIDGPLVDAAWQAFLRGIENAAAETDSVAASAATFERQHQAVAARGLELVRDAAIRAFRNDIAAALQAGEYDGLAPARVARELRARFGHLEYNWERLAASEIAQAQGDGKIAQYAGAGITQMDWVAAPDACPVCLELAAGSPYAVGSKRIMADSHPMCRCSVRAVVE